MNKKILDEFDKWRNDGEHCSLDDSMLNRYDVIMLKEFILNALQQKDQALIDTFLKMKGNNKFVDDVIDSVIEIIKEQQWET